MSKQPWYSIRAAAGGADIFIYDVIDPFFGYSAKSFADELKALGPVAEITVRINSPGGDVFDGLAIYNLLLQHGARIVVHVDGLAASIASVIAMAGAEIVMAETAHMMIHDPSGVVYGTAEEMRDLAAVLEKLKDSLVTAYERKSKLPRAEIEALMAAETWLTAGEAKEKGFADIVAIPVQAAAAVDPDRLARFANVPTALRAPRPAASAAQPEQETIMTTPTPAARPEADIRAEAQKAERDRIVAIRNATIPGHEALAEQHIAEGGSPGDFALAQAAAEKTKAAARLSALRAQVDEQPQPQPQIPPAPKPEVKEDAAPETDEAAKVAYAGSAKLQAEFKTEARYLAFCRAARNGQIRIFKGRSAA